MEDRVAGVVELGAFVVPEASDLDAVVEQVLAVERAGLDLVGIQDHPYQRRFFDTFSLLASWRRGPSARGGIRARSGGSPTSTV
jgi:hypothetical protein